MTNIEKIYSLLEKAYFMEGISSDNKENESNLQDFETKFQVNIPLDYRWLLNNFGSCNFSDPYIYGITDLNRCYSHFMKKWNEYINLGYNMSECLSPFPIGGFGDGDNAVIGGYTGGKINRKISNKKVSLIFVISILFIIMMQSIMIIFKYTN